MIKKKNNILKEISLSTVVLGTMVGMSFLGHTVHADAINTSNNLQSEDIKVNNNDNDIKQVRNVTETINYVYEDGSQAAPTKTVTRSFSRMDIENKENGVIVNPGGDWNIRSQTFDAVSSPIISGYKSSENEIGAQTVNPDSQNLTFKVIYSPVNSTVNNSVKESNEASITTAKNISGNTNAEENNNIKSSNNNTSKLTTKSPVEANANSSEDTTKVTENKPAVLPQTGVKQSNQILVSIMGIVMSLLSILGITKKAIEKL